MTPIEAVKAEHKKMYHLMEAFGDFGAFDTEPDTIYQLLIVRQLVRVQVGDGMATPPPRTIDGWSLFPDKGAGKVAKRMGKQSTRVCTAIRYAISCGQWREVCRWAKETCWRIECEWQQ